MSQQPETGSPNPYRTPRSSESSSSGGSQGVMASSDGSRIDLNKLPTFAGHPIGLYICFFTEMWERFSFYGMKALLLLYITKYHLFSDASGFNLLGSYGGLVYAVPVVGGLLADRYLGMRKAVIFGGVLLVLGHLGMAFEGQAAQRLADGSIVRDETALQIFYFSLALIICGVGFLKPNISTIVGRLYAENDPRTEAGFTIFYAGINLGAFISALFCGWLGETYGWGYGFGAAGLGMVLGLITFILGQGHLYGQAEPPNPSFLQQKWLGPLSREWVIYLGTLLGVGLIWLLIQAHSIFIPIVAGVVEFSPVVLVMHLVSIILLVGIVWFMTRHCTRVEAQRLWIVLLLIFWGALFFALYEQTAGSWVLFSDRAMDRNAFGVQWTASQLQSLGALFIFLLTPIFAWLWPRLDRWRLNPNKPAKAGWGLIFGGLAFALLAWSASQPLPNGLTALSWFVLAYLVLEVGEMFVSPIGLAAVTQLSVSRVVSLMMGGWFLGTAYSEILAAALGKLAAVDLHENDVAANVAELLPKYQSLFVFSAQIGIVSGIVALLIAPFAKRWMHGVK